MVESPLFDVFLAHNSVDKPQVRAIAEELRKRGLKPWLDEEQIPPGRSFQEEIQQAIPLVKSAAIFIGLEGLGRWQVMELRSFISRCVRENISVIPVLLPNVSKVPDDLRFLQEFRWVSFASGTDDSQSLDRLVWGITGIKPEAPITPSFPSLQVFEFDEVTLNTQEQVIKRSRLQSFYFEENLGNEIVLEMVLIPGGTFQMGLPEGQKGYADELPQHEVTVKPFFMGKYPVTQAQWRAVASLPKVNRDLNPEPSYFKGDNRPVETVSWYDAVEFCDRLSGKTRREYRLPSEAEWEYACRAGTTTPFHFGPKITHAVANYVLIGMAIGRLLGATTEVGSFKVANAFGLYDMHGNVWEWCADTWHKNYEGAPNDASVWTQGGNYNFYHRRGGSWDNIRYVCRSAWRDHSSRDDRYFDSGFRVVCVAPRTT